MAVPRISLADLEPPTTGIATPAFATAAEKLATAALSRARVAVIVLPGEQAAALTVGLQTLLEGNTRSVPGCDVREWRAGGPPGAPAIEQVRAAQAAAVFPRDPLRRPNSNKLTHTLHAPLVALQLPAGIWHPRKHSPPRAERAVQKQLAAPAR